MCIKDVWTSKVSCDMHVSSLSSLVFYQCLCPRTRVEEGAEVIQQYDSERFLQVGGEHEDIFSHTPRCKK